MACGACSAQAPVLPLCMTEDDQRLELFQPACYSEHSDNLTVWLRAGRSNRTPHPLLCYVWHIALQLYVNTWTAARKPLNRVPVWRRPAAADDPLAWQALLA